MPEEVVRRAERAIDEKVFPGCVIGIIKNGERTILPFGRLTYENDSLDVGEDTIYDIASITKSIPVASLAAIFIEGGKLHLDDKVTKFIPELRNDFGATIEDLLRYRVSGLRMSTLRVTTFEEVRAHIFEHGFDGPPGESSYSNLPAFLLGIVVERVGSGPPAGGLPALANKYFFEPLKMSDTTFFPAPRSLGEVGPHDLEHIAPTEIVDGKEIRGIVHDESARLFAKARRAVGHAGLFSSAPDLLNFFEAMLDGRLKLVAEYARRGLGWELHQKWMGHHANELFGKSGFTGTVVMCDAERQIALVILSNRTYPHRPADSSAIHSFRADIADIVFSQ